MDTSKKNKLGPGVLCGFAVGGIIEMALRFQLGPVLCVGDCEDDEPPIPTLGSVP